MNPVFAMTGGRVRLEGREVLRGVDLRVDSGEMLAVLGPNGSGKSTLIRALLGLVPLSGGHTAIYGSPPARFRDWKRIGYVPQRLTVGGGVPATVREIVASGRLARQSRFRFASAADRTAIDRALEAVGLTDRVRDSAHQLSGGQQQRVLIARALAGEPDALVMDEPTAGVDAVSQAALAECLRLLVEQGRTVVLVAHELGPLEPLVSRAIVLTAGRIAQEGPPPRPEGECARPGHDHVHPHAPAEDAGPLASWRLIQDPPSAGAGSSSGSDRAPGDGPGVGPGVAPGGGPGVGSSGGSSGGPRSGSVGSADLREHRTGNGF